MDAAPSPIQRVGGMKVYDTPPPDWTAKPAPKEGAPAAPESPTGKRDDLLKMAEQAHNPDAGVLRLIRMMSGNQKPETLNDYIALTGANAAIMAATGGAAGAGAAALNAPRAVAGLAGPVARVATAGGLAKGRGESNTMAAIDMAGAGTGELAMGALAKVLGAPAKGLEEVNARVVKSDPLNGPWLEKLLRWWKADPNKAVQAERARHIADTITQHMDPSGEAAAIFKEQVVKGAKIPLTHKAPYTPSPRVSRAADAVIDNPVTRGAVAGITGTPPASALAAAAIPKLGQALASKVIPHSLRPRALDDSGGD